MAIGYLLPFKFFQITFDNFLCLNSNKKILNSLRFSNDIIAELDYKVYRNVRILRILLKIRSI